MGREKYKAAVESKLNYASSIRRMEDYKANYIKGLQNAFGDYAKNIIAIVERLPADVVVNTHYKEQEATIDFFYEKQDMDLKLDILENIWQGVYADEIGS